MLVECSLRPGRPDPRVEVRRRDGGLERAVEYYAHSHGVHSQRERRCSDRQAAPKWDDARTPRLYYLIDSKRCVTTPALNEQEAPYEPPTYPVSLAAEHRV